MKSTLKYIVFALMALMPLSDLDAKGSTGGRSSFSRSPAPVVRTPSPSVSKPSGGFSSNSTKPSAVKPSSPPTTKNAFDKSQAARYVAPPPPVKPKNEYIADFKKNNASKYPTKFSTPPATRPSYVPPTTTYQGQQREIVYNQSAGGYGFMDGLGQFMIYDAITDMASNAFQKDQTVYVQQSKEYDSAVKQQQVVAQQKDEGWSGFEIFLAFLVGGFFLIFIIGLFTSDQF